MRWKEKHGFFLKSASFISYSANCLAVNVYGKWKKQKINLHCADAKFWFLFNVKGAVRD